MKRKIRRAFAFVFSTVLFAGCSGCENTDESPAYDIGGKTYWNTEERYGNETHSRVWFGKDGSFVITDNFYDGYYEITGTWEINENVLTLDVESSGAGSFKKILFEVQDDQTIVLHSTLAGSYSGDVFSTEETTGSGGSTTLGPGGSTTPPDTGRKELYTFYNATQIPGKQSSITIYSDDTFTYVERYSAGSNTIIGNVEWVGYMIKCKDFDPFYGVGEKLIYDFEFVRDSDTCIILQNTLVSSFSGDPFTVDGTLPASYTAVTPPPTPSAPVTPGSGIPTIEAMYVHEYMEDVNEAYYPKIEFHKDASFVFTENFYAGMGFYKGWYDINSSGYVCHVTEFNSPAGNKVETIEFSYANSGEICLETDLSMSQKGDVFIIQE